MTTTHLRTDRTSLTPLAHDTDRQADGQTDKYRRRNPVRLAGQSKVHQTISQVMKCFWSYYKVQSCTHNGPTTGFISDSRQCLFVLGLSNLCRVASVASRVLFAIKPRSSSAFCLIHRWSACRSKVGDQRRYNWWRCRGSFQPLAKTMPRWTQHWRRSCPFGSAWAYGLASRRIWQSSTASS